LAVAILTLSLDNNKPSENIFDEPSPTNFLEVARSSPSPISPNCKNGISKALFGHGKVQSLGLGKLFKNDSLLHWTIFGELFLNGQATPRKMLFPGSPQTGASYFARETLSNLHLAIEECLNSETLSRNLRN
jgi:hypothetical protein